MGAQRDAVLGGQTISLFGSMIVQYAVMWCVTLETLSEESSGPPREDARRDA